VFAKSNRKKLHEKVNKLEKAVVLSLSMHLSNEFNVNLKHKNILSKSFFIFH